MNPVRPRMPHRLLPATAREAVRYLVRLAALLLVCDTIGLLVVYFQKPWPWDLPTALGTTIFGGALLVCLMFFGEAVGYGTTARRATLNTRLEDAVVRARKEDLAEGGSDTWWALLGLSLLGISLVFVFNSLAGMILAIAPVPLGLIAWAVALARRPDPRSEP